MRKRLIVVTVLGLIVSLIGLSSLAYAQDDTIQSSSSSITVQSIPGPTVAQKLTARTKTSWSWYVTRGSGLIAAVSLVLLLISGIGQVTGYTYKFLEPITAWASHRALGIAFGVSVLVHIFSLLFDHFVNFSFWQLFVPWLSNYRPTTIFGRHAGSIFVALGVLAFYGVVIVIITSLIWVEKKPYTWKMLHLLSYLIILLVFIHALYIGTDLAHGIFRWLWIGAGISIAIATIHRLRRAKSV
jgi:methionine sulfoxide reductase heme-binding subunit